MKFRDSAGPAKWGAGTRRVVRVDGFTFLQLVYVTHLHVIKRGIILYFRDTAPVTFLLPLEFDAQICVLMTDDSKELMSKSSVICKNSPGKLPIQTFTCH